MAYQPIQMAPDNSGWDMLSQGLRSAARAKQERDRLAAANLQQQFENKRQRENDFQGALMKAEQLKKAGDVEGARAVLAPFADSPDEGQIQTRAMQAPKAWQANMNTGEYGDAVINQMGDVLNSGDWAGGSPAAKSAQAADQANLAKMASGVSAVDVFGGGSQAPGAQPGQPMQPQAQQGAPMGAPAIPGAAPAANPLVAAAQGDQAQKARMAKFFTGRFNGQQLTFDPEAEKADNLARADKAFAETGADDHETGSLVRELYPQMRAAAIASGEPLDVKETLKYIQGEVKGRRSEAAQAAREEEFNRTFGQRADLTDKRLKQSDTNSIRGAQARVTAAGVMAQPAVKADARNTADSSNLGNAIHKYFTDFDGKTLLKSDRLLNAAITNVAAQGPDAVMSHKDAFFALERYFRGGIPTDSETQLLLKHMGGIVGAKDKFLEDMKTGDFSPITVQNIATAAARAKEENDRNKARFVSGAMKRFGPNSEYRLMGPNVNSYMSSIAGGFDLDVPDLYPEGTGGEGVTLGSGERPNVGKAPRRLPQPGKGGKGGMLPTGDYVKMLQQNGEAK